GEPRS
ncbi:his Kinase A domain protein, partial [Vibrio parahaemolyticus VPTS-2010]